MPLKARGSGDWAPLPESVPLPVEIDDVPKGVTGMEDNEQAKFPVRVIEGPYMNVTKADGKVVPGRCMIWLGLTVGASNTGQPSKLRQMLEAIYGPLTNEQAEAIDLETLKGQRFVMVGQYRNRTKENPRLTPIAFSKYMPGQVSYTPAPGMQAAYQVPGAPTAATFQPPPAAAPSAPPPPPATALPPPPAPVAKPMASQFSPDGQYGWNGAEWRPVAEFSNAPTSGAQVPVAADGKPKEDVDF